MLFTSVKQGKGCDYFVQRSWTDHASESKIPCLLTGAQDKSSCGWSTRQGRLSSAPNSSAQCSVCDPEQVTNSLFLFPLWWKWWRWSWLFSAELQVRTNLHFKVFVILCTKHIANITALPPPHHRIYCNLTQVHTTNSSFTTLILTICSIRKLQSCKKPLLKSVKQRRTWKAGSGSSISAGLPAIHNLDLQVLLMVVDGILD